MYSILYFEGNEVSSKEYFFAFIAVAVLFYFLLRFIKKDKKKLPPGPTGLPIVGYLPFLGSEPHKTLFDLRKKYGNIIGIRFGSNFVVILNEYEIMKETLSHPYSLDREPYLFGSIPTGFLTLNGQEWVESRRFCLHAMRNLGLARKRWETITEDSARSFIHELSNFKNKPVVVSKMLHVATSNNIISLLIGRKLKFPSEKDKIEVFTQYSDVFLNYVRIFRIDSIIPGLRTFCEYLGIGSFGRAAKVISTFVHFVKEDMKKHRTLPEYKEMDDFINLYYEKMKFAKSQEKYSFSDEKLLGELSVLFLGSSDTVASSMGWLIRLMAKYQDIQHRVHQELDEVIGRDRTLSYEDRLKVPYTIAVMMESQRFSSIVPLSTTRIAIQDFEIRGYTIPKGAMIMGNTWAIHMDPNYWEKPEEFRPDRFLVTGENKVLKNIPSFAPFSVGRRNCPGETVAWMVIFSFFTALMQKFKISHPPGHKPELEIDGGLVQYLKPEPLCFTERV